MSISIELYYININTMIIYLKCILIVYIRVGVDRYIFIYFIFTAVLFVVVVEILVFVFKEYTFLVI